MANVIKPTGNIVKFEEDGDYRIMSPAFEFSGIQCTWGSDTIAATGTLTFISETDAGIGNNIIDLGAGQRAIRLNMGVQYLDVTVAGLPAGGAVTLYLTRR